MSPFEHGEVFVLDDGGEADLDLGNYERFLGVRLSRDHNITTGKVGVTLFVPFCVLLCTRGFFWSCAHAFFFLVLMLFLLVFLTSAWQAILPRSANRPKGVCGTRLTLAACVFWCVFRLSFPVRLLDQGCRTQRERPIVVEGLNYNHGLCRKANTIDKCGAQRPFGVQERVCAG